MADPASYPVGTIAKLLMLSERRVQQLNKSGHIPRNERGRYELAPAVQGYIRFLQERNLGRDGAGIDYNAEKARKTRAEADIAEVDAARIRGEVATLKQVQRATEMAFAEVKANLRNVPSRVVGQIIGETEEYRIKDILLAEIDGALTALADGIELDDPEEDEDEQGEV
jgi:phage terminase Nu1 subunit (DNA packaging protein)